MIGFLWLTIPIVDDTLENKNSTKLKGGNCFFCIFLTLDVGSHRDVHRAILIVSCRLESQLRKYAISNVLWIVMKRDYVESIPILRILRRLSFSRVLTLPISLRTKIHLYIYICIRGARMPDAEHRAKFIHRIAMPQGRQLECRHELTNPFNI